MGWRGAKALASARYVPISKNKYMVHGKRKPAPLYPIPFSFSRARTT